MTTSPIEPGKLGLGPWNLSTNAAISIEPERRDALAAADEGIVAMIHFEDRYAMVIDNLMDMERHLFNWSLLDMLRPMAGFDDLFIHKRDANRLFGNLLSAARQYIDQTHHHMKGYFGATELTSQAALSEQYKAHLSFRIMEALRNYVQHEDLGVHTVSVGGAWLDADGKKVRRYTVSIGIDLDHLSDATKFKASTLAEMKALPAMPDLKEVMRAYVSALGTAHERMRKALKPQTDMWIAAVDAAFVDVQTAYPGKKQYRLAVFEQNEDALRFAPGRSDALSINPLLTFRGGLHAWADARRLGAALLSGGRASAQDATIDAFALLMLDQLRCGPIEARTLTALRRRLVDPIALVPDLCGRWALTPADDAAPVTWEMARAARVLRSEPDHSIRHYALIDRALAGFADAGLARATSAHHLNLAQFVSASAPPALVLSMEDAAAAPLIYALLTQLAALHTSAAGAQHLLFAVEAEAARILAEHVDMKRKLPASPKIRVVLQASDMSYAERLAGETGSLDAVVAIGPQPERSAAALSQRGGRCITHDPIPHRIPRWRSLLFPTWISRETERLPEAALKAAGADHAFLLVPQQKPARLNVLRGGGATTYMAVREPAAHDWSAPSLAAASLTPDAPNAASPTTPAGPTSAKLRRVLTRRSATPPSKGAPRP